MEIRYEKPENISAIRWVNDTAFETRAEADLVDTLRDKKAHIMKPLPNFSAHIIDL